MFAKLFERDGHQVLVTKETDDDKEPVLQIRFKTLKSGHDVSIRLSLKPDSVLNPEAVLDKAFDTMDEKSAFAIRDGAPGLDM